MHPFASGAAFVDREGVLVAADATFLETLGLGPDDPTARLRERAESVPELRALLSSEGPSRVQIVGAVGTLVDVERVASEKGALIVVREARALGWLEHAMRSHSMTRLAAGMAHDIKNPLNAMSLQIALLVEKLSGDYASAASSGHLGALREQIGRINEVLRRFLDVTDPSAPLGYTDLGLLLGDTASLFAHDARRRRIEIAFDGPGGIARTRCDPARVGRLLVGLLARALAETPDGGRLSGRAEIAGPDAVVSIEHTAGDPDPDLGYYTHVAAAVADALGGRFSLGRMDAMERLTLTLPRNDRE